MVLIRQEGRGRPSRSRKEDSNKENVCPSQNTDSVALEVVRRRSPLPEGFPRSPLQDITHIICPHNIWPDNEDLPTDQVRKKFRKGNFAESCIAIEASDSTIQQEAAQQQCNLSWKGLVPCVHAKIGADVLQAQALVQEKENPKQSVDMDDGAISGEARLQKNASDLCIYRDSVPTDASSLPNCEFECRQDAKSMEQMKQAGVLDTEAHLIQHQKISVTQNCSVLKQSVGNRSSMQTVLVGKKNRAKGLAQSAQLKKKSNLSMLR